MVLYTLKYNHAHRHHEFIYTYIIVHIYKYTHMQWHKHIYADTPIFIHAIQMQGFVDILKYIYIC